MLRIIIIALFVMLTSCSQNAEVEEASTPKSLFSVNENGVQFELDGISLDIGEDGVNYSAGEETINIGRDGINVDLSEETTQGLMKEFEKGVQEELKNAQQNQNIAPQETSISPEITREIEVKLKELEQIADQYDLSEERKQELKDEIIYKLLQKEVEKL